MSADPKFHYSLEETSQKPGQGARSIQLRLTGILNEDVNLGNTMEDIVRARPLFDVLLLDVSEIEEINSCGVREWLLFLAQVEAAFPVEFQNVGRAFMEQSSIVPNILGKSGTAIRSFEVPYVCGKCSKQFAGTFTKADLTEKNGVFESPPMNCQDCKTPLEFDGFEEEYFFVFKR